MKRKNDLIVYKNAEDFVRDMGLSEVDIALVKEKRITFNASFKLAVAWLEDSYGCPLSQAKNCYPLILFLPVG